MRYRILAAKDDPWINTAIAPDAGTVAATTETGVLLWDGATGRPRHAIRDVPPKPRVLMFSPDGRTLAAGYADGALILWGATTGKQLARFPGHEWKGERFGIRTLAFARDGTALASIESTGVNEGFLQLRIVRVPRPSVVAILHGQDDIFTCLAFSPDGKTLASGGVVWTERSGNEGLLRLWDVERGVERASFKTPGRSILSLAYSPDGTTLAAADMVSIILRDPATGAERATLVGENFYNEFMGIGFSPDGKTLASMNRVFRLWRPVPVPAPRPDQDRAR